MKNLMVTNRLVRIRIQPSEEQISYFNKCFGMSRYAYNWYLEKMDLYQIQKIHKSFYEIRKEFNSFKNTNFLKDVNPRILIHALGNAKNAYNMFFNKKARHPKFKSKKWSKQTFGLDRCLVDITTNVLSPYKKYKHYFNGFHFYISGPLDKCGRMNGFFIKTLENIDFLKGKKIFQVTITRTNDGKYYAIFGYKESILHKNNFTKTVGIDLGLKTFATQSDGIIAKLPKQRIIKLEKKISKLQRAVSKKQKDSKNYSRTKKKLNKYYQKIANIKQDFLHKYTTWLAKNYKIIKLEDLSVSEWFKNRKIVKSVARSNFCDFKLKLKYKTKWYDSKLIIIDKYYPSSKLCSHCGNKKKKQKLSDRIYICDKCGFTIDRDLNAAINILKY